MDQFPRHLGVCSVSCTPSTAWEGRDVSAVREELGKVLWTPVTFAIWPPVVGRY